MTPEQRETHAETLRAFTIHHERQARMAHHAADSYDENHVPEEAAKQRALAVEHEGYRAACLAGAAALAPPPTCGTCRHVKMSPAQFGIPALYMCGNRKAPAFVASEVSPDDGCIKGYAPTEPTR